MKKNQQLSLITIMSLSLVLSPFLITILILKTWEEYLLKIGKFSEEIFRSEQLPLLSLADRASLAKTTLDQ